MVVGIEVGMEDGIDVELGMDDETRGTEIGGSSWLVGMEGGAWEDSRGTWVDLGGSWTGGLGLLMWSGES